LTTKLTQLSLLQRPRSSTSGSHPAVNKRQPLPERAWSACGFPQERAAATHRLGHAGKTIPTATAATIAFTGCHPAIRCAARTCALLPDTLLRSYRDCLCPFQLSKNFTRRSSTERRRAAESSSAQRPRRWMLSTRSRMLTTQRLPLRSPLVILTPPSGGRIWFFLPSSFLPPASRTYPP